MAGKSVDFQEKQKEALNTVILFVNHKFTR